VPGTDAGSLAREDLHKRIYEFAQLSGVLVVYVGKIVDAKKTSLLFFNNIIVHKA
jgi:hypothetical protein